MGVGSVLIMKKKIFYLSVFLSLILAMISCGDEDVLPLLEGPQLIHVTLDNEIRMVYEYNSH